MGSNSRPRCIGILAHVGNQNLGDEALVAAVIQGIRRTYPDAIIRGFTTNPRDTSSRHGIVAFPLRRTESSNGSGGPPARGHGHEAMWRGRYLDRLKAAAKRVGLVRRSLQAFRKAGRTVSAVVREPAFLVAAQRNLRGVDLLVVAGSQQLNDAFGGPWGFPYTLWKWSLLARVTGTKVAYLSVGAGPIDAPLSQRFVRQALSLASYRSHRDALSSQLIEGIGVRGEGPVVPDLVYGLRIAAPVANGSGRAVTPLVGANPVPLYDGRYWSIEDATRYSRYIATFAAFCDQLVQSDHRIAFFPTQLQADPPVIEDIRRQMTARDAARAGVTTVSGIRSLEDLVAEIAQMDLVVANRYHGILISLLLQKPVLALAYHGKTFELMAMMGQAEYAVEASSCTTELLAERFASLEARAPEIRREVVDRAAALRQVLEGQYARVFALVNGETRLAS